MEYYRLNDFNSSHFFVKAEEVFGFGEHIESWKFKDKFITLYSYSNFFIEITFDPRVKSISKIKAISCDKACEKYVLHTDLKLELQKIGDTTKFP